MINSGVMCGIRASRIDEEMLTAMKESGCEHVTLAPESGSPRVLEEIMQHSGNGNEQRGLLGIHELTMITPFYIKTRTFSSGTLSPPPTPVALDGCTRPSPKARALQCPSSSESVARPMK